EDGRPERAAADSAGLAVADGADVLIDRRVDRGGRGRHAAKIGIPRPLLDAPARARRERGSLKRGMQIPLQGDARTPVLTRVRERLFKDLWRRALWHVGLRHVSCSSWS